MLFSRKKKYIQLGQGLLSHEQEWLEQSIQAALPPVLPTDRFLIELEDELVREAERQLRREHDLDPGLRLLGFIGGGLLSIAGGILVWALWQRRRAQKDGDKVMASPKRLSFLGMSKFAKVAPAV